MKLSLFFLLLPTFCFSQVYNFNRQQIIKYDNEHTSHADTWLTPITIEVKNRIVIMKRPSNGAGEKHTADTLKIKSINKKAGKQNEITRIKFIDGRIMAIYGDNYITMQTKESKDHKRIEYFFYNQQP